MPSIKTKDEVAIFYKDWGSGQPIVFSHGWPLSANDWDNQMLFFLKQGYRAIAHDRWAHEGSTQVADGHDMDHHADDLAAGGDYQRRAAAKQFCSEVVRGLLSEHVNANPTFAGRPVNE